MTKVFRPMRSIAPDPKYPIRYPKMASKKLDGIRFCKRDGKAISKSGKPIVNNHIREWIEAHAPEGVDGEIISGPPNLETTYDTTFKAVMTIKGEPDFHLYVFDLCGEPDNTTAELRSVRLRQLCEDLDEPKIVFVKQSVLHSDEETAALYNLNLLEGYEGMILKDPKGLYKWGRSTAKEQTQLKLKPEEDHEAKVLGLYEGMHNANEAYTNDVGETARSTHAENKVPNGMLGGFHVEDVKTGARFNVAPGKLSHDDRRAIWRKHLKDPLAYIGDYVKYRAMAYGTMANNAARHGRWIGWRDLTDMEPEDLK